MLAQGTVAKRFCFLLCWGGCERSMLNGGEFVEDFTTKDKQEALRAIASMINRTENVKVKFAQGTSQHTLQKNRLRALHIASTLISKELAHSEAMDSYSNEELKKALDPIASLIRKSEKAKGKVVQGSWQYTMLEDNLKALYIAIPLLEKAVREEGPE